MKKKQKVTTKNGLKTTTEKSSRSSSKYPALDKRKNLPSRQDLIDFDYLSKLGPKELEFLNDFVEETIVTNFAHHKLIKGLLSKKKTIIEDGTVQEIKIKVNKLKEIHGENTPKIKELMLLIREIKKQNEVVYEDDLTNIESELEALREQFLLYPNKEDHKVFYSENNARNMCLLNKKKTEMRLDELDPEKYDEMADTSMYSISSENDLIDLIERSKWEAEEDRLNDIISQEKRSRRNLKS
jgi:hypothetical protein